MNDTFLPYHQLLIHKYFQKGILLDTNVLLLLLIGLHDPSYIEEFGKTEKYTKEDFDKLLKMVSIFSNSHLAVTPHILAEVTSSPNRPKDKKRLQAYFSTFVENLSKAKESHTQKEKIFENRFLPQFGVTDTSIFMLAQNKKYLIITDDGPLTGLIQSHGLDVINFEEFRIPLP